MPRYLVSSTPLLVLILTLVFPSTSLARAKVPYQSCFHTASILHQVPMDLLLAVARTESNMDPMAVSHANAHGLMQIQWPGTAKHLGARRLSELYNPCLNISLGAQYLAELFMLFNGDETKVLAAYNYGPTRIKAATNIPPGAMTYVKRVNKHRAKLRQKPSNPSDIVAQDKDARVLVTFDANIRAQRMARLLRKKIVSANIQVKNGNEVHLITKGTLSYADRLILEQFGFLQ